MTPDNYKQSFTDESGKIQKKVFEIIKKKSFYSTKSSIYTCTQVSQL